MNLIRIAAIGLIVFSASLVFNKKETLHLVVTRTSLWKPTAGQNEQPFSQFIEEIFYNVVSPQCCLHATSTIFIALFVARLFIEPQTMKHTDDIKI